MNGKLYALGGLSSYEGTNEVDVYDPLSGKWSASQTLPTAEQSMASGVINGTLYLAGGTCYDEDYSFLVAYIAP